MDLKDPAILQSISKSIMRPSPSLPVNKLYKGEPMALGITQILIGILEIAFGLAIAIPAYSEISYIYYDYTDTPYWMAVLYIISGSLSVAVANPRIPLVKGMLAMNIVSTVGAGVVIILYSIILAHPRHYYTCNPSLPLEICHEHVIIPEAQKLYISVVLFIVTILEFLIAITTSAFGCASVCRKSFSETTVVIFQNAAQETPPAVLTPVKEEEEEVS